MMPENRIDIEQIRKSAKAAAMELCKLADLRPGNIVIAGCSTSEIAGIHIGSGGSAEIGTAVFEVLYHVFLECGVSLAAQCCEHLNRAIIIERAAAAGDVVNVVPYCDAGGAFATAAYAGFSEPCAIEEIRADAGLDIGGTLIGMHLKKVAVPIRLETARIGFAALTAARTRPKLIGGIRARYDDCLL